jgi:hypothetical protein
MWPWAHAHPLCFTFLAVSALSAAAAVALGLCEALAEFARPLAVLARWIARDRSQRPE